MAGWTPPGWSATKTATRITNEATGTWPCSLCKTEQPYGAAKVMTDIGMVCVNGCTGGHTKKQQGRSSSSGSSCPPPPAAQTSTTPVPEAPRTNRGNGEMKLNPRQVEFLEEALTARQWRQLLELQ